MQINEIILHCRLVTQRPCSSSTCQYRIWCSAVSICHWQRRSSTNEPGCWATRFAFCSRSCATDFSLFPSSPCWPSRSTATSWSDTPGSTQSEFDLIKYKTDRIGPVNQSIVHETCRPTRSEQLNNSKIWKSRQKMALTSRTPFQGLNLCEILNCCDEWMKNCIIYQERGKANFMLILTLWVWFTAPLEVIF